MDLWFIYFSFFQDVNGGVSVNFEASFWHLEEKQDG